MTKILFVDDEEHLRKAAVQTFQLADLQIHAFDSAENLLADIRSDLDAIIISDIRMPKMDGVELLKAVLEVDADFPVILVTGHGDVDLAVKCMRDGAYDFIEKPYDPYRLVETARRAAEKRRLTLENRELRSAIVGRSPLDSELIGNAPIMRQVREQLLTLAEMETDILIVGPTGCGKDIAARMIHSHSDRADGPFVHINCAALPTDLVEIELFGHEVGAFPSAIRSRFGKFEHARGGIVYLDGVETLPLQVQAKLVSAIENRTITRLGSNDPIELDVRFISAAKTDLEAEATAGRFGKDLYYRLSKAQIRMPSLDDHKEDLPHLFLELVRRAAIRHDRPVPKIAEGVYAILAARKWPGNVRELSNVAERYVLGLDFELSNFQPSVATEQTLAAQMANQERALIAASLAAHNGKLKQTYETLGISRKALYEKMQRYGLNREDFGGE